jgi:hypothetical protein
MLHPYQPSCARMRGTAYTALVVQCRVGRIACSPRGIQAVPMRGLGAKSASSTCSLEGEPGGSGYAAVADSAPEQAEHRVRGRAAGIAAERPRYRGQLTFQQRDFLSAVEQPRELGSQALGPHLAL